MPTKRTRKPRHAEQRVTPEALEHYRAALALQDRYFECIDGKRICTRRDHCEECAAYLEHKRTMRRELQLRPWETDPLTDDSLRRGPFHAD